MRNPWKLICSITDALTITSISTVTDRGHSYIGNSGDRLRRQFPPSSSVLTLALFQIVFRFSRYILYTMLRYPTERTSEQSSGRYMDIRATFYGHPKCLNN